MRSELNAMSTVSIPIVITQCRILLLYKCQTSSDSPPLCDKNHLQNLQHNLQHNVQQIYNTIYNTIYNAIYNTIYNAGYNIHKIKPPTFFHEKLMSVKNTIFSFPESIPKMPQQKRTKNVKHAKKVIDGFPLILIFSLTFSEISLKRMWLYVSSDIHVL